MAGEPWFPSCSCPEHGAPCHRYASDHCCCGKEAKVTFEGGQLVLRCFDNTCVFLATAAPWERDYCHYQANHLICCPGIRDDALSYLHGQGPKGSLGHLTVLDLPKEHRSRLGCIAVAAEAACQVRLCTAQHNSLLIHAARCSLRQFLMACV
jgi:hypothetical protein